MELDDEVIAELNSQLPDQCRLKARIVNVLKNCVSEIKTLEKSLSDSETSRALQELHENALRQQEAIEKSCSDATLVFQNVDIALKEASKLNLVLEPIYDRIIEAESREELERDKSTIQATIEEIPKQLEENDWNKIHSSCDALVTALKHYGLESELSQLALDMTGKVTAAVLGEYKSLISRINFPVLAKSNAQTFVWDEQDQVLFLSLYVILQKTGNLKLERTSSFRKRLLAVPAGMWALVEPLEKRFLYNFYGSKATNMPDRPEWFLNQLVAWIAMNDYAVTCMERDLVLLSPQNELLAGFRSDFIQALVVIAIDKLEFEFGLASTPSGTHLNCLTGAVGQEDEDSPSVGITGSLEDATLFGHVIDQVLIFDGRIGQIAVLEGRFSLAQVLANPAILDRWIDLESHLATERLQAMLSRPQLWLSAEADFVHEFVAMLQSINKRGIAVGGNIPLARFLRLQLNLLRQCYKQLNAHLMEHLGSHWNADRGLVMRSTFGTQAVTHVCLLLNALSALMDVMFEWANDPVYVKAWQNESIRCLLQGEEANETLPQTETLWAAALVLGGEEARDSSLEDVGVFQSVYELYSRHVDRWLQHLCDSIMQELRRALAEYVGASDFWQRVEDDRETLSLTDTAAEGLSVLQVWLTQLKSQLHASLFAKIWHAVARGVNLFLFNKLIRVNSFGAFGATQLRHDLHNGFCALFAEFTGKLNHFFVDCLEASTLLSQKHALALLLLDSLQTSKNPDDQKATLQDLGITNLEPNTAVHILRLRSDLP